MSGNATGSQIGGFAVALRSKGETAAEVAGMAAVMLSHAKRVSLDMAAADVVGTGGDQSGTVNISTMSALVTAAAGVPVVKHGNRAASSRCGAADVLESLGVVIELSPEAVATCVREIGIGFCFAPAFHPALRHAGPTRSRARHPDGVQPPRPADQPGTAHVGPGGLRERRGWRRSWPRCWPPGASRCWSSAATTGSTRSPPRPPPRRGWPPAASSGRPPSTRWQLGVAPVAPEDLKGGDAAVNAAVLRALVAGEQGAVRDTVLLNAAGAIAAFRGLSGDSRPHCEPDSRKQPSRWTPDVPQRCWSAGSS